MSTPGKYGEVKPIKLAATGQLPERECYDFYGDKEERGSTQKKDLFLKDALINQDQLFRWAQLAYYIFRSNENSYWDHAGNGWDTDFGSGHYFDTIDCLCNEHNMQGGDDKYKSTGLTLTTSLDEVEKAAGTMAEELIGRKLKANDFINRATLEPFHGKTDKQTVFYSIVGNRDRYGKTYQFGYTVLGLAFYNFRLKVVSDGNAFNSAIGNMTVEEAIKRGGIAGFTYHEDGTGETLTFPAVNTGTEESSQTATTTVRQSETEANTITNSKEFNFSEMVGVSLMAKDILKVSEATIQMQFTAGQVISTAYTDEHSVTKETGGDSSVTVPLPPHTALVVKQKQGNTVTTLEYDCPVLVQFDVGVFSICGTCYDDNAAVHTFSTKGYDQRSFITLFQASDTGDAGEDASENLYLRSHHYEEVPGYEKSHGVTQGKSHDRGLICSSVDWKKILDEKAETARTGYQRPGEKVAATTSKPEELILLLAKNLPMSPTGGMLTETSRSISSTIGSAIPLYALHRLALLNASLEYHIGIGDKMYPFNWTVSGYDVQNVPFYGFDSSAGEWILVDENGQKITESDIASIGREPLTNTLFIKGNGEGTVYAKYLIPDDFYKCQAGTPITNNTIHTVFVKIMVHPNELQGHISASGSVTCPADGSAVNLEAADTLQVMVYDEQEREIPVPVLWEAQESAARGITVFNNQMMVSRPGVFHIRAVYENLCSNWVEVHGMAN